MSEPLVVLGWSGCPTTGDVPEWVARTCAAAGVLAPELRIEYVETDEEAAERRFIGSPTFTLDGADLFPEPEAPPSLTCRVYRRRDGRFSPLPDPADFIDALLRSEG